MSHLRDGAAWLSDLAACPARASPPAPGETARCPTHGAPDVGTGKFFECGCSASPRESAECSNNAPAGFTGHWREWHRGHGCNKDPDVVLPAPCAGHAPYVGCVNCAPRESGGGTGDAPCPRHGALVCEECAHEAGFREGVEAAARKALDVDLPWDGRATYGLLEQVAHEIRSLSPAGDTNTSKEE
jgi:hypothetical protein